MSARQDARATGVAIYFTDFFEIDPSVLDEYGAFNVSLINDLPLFIDPFLLFDSEKSKYRELHDEIIRYLRFLRDESVSGGLDRASISQWFHFKEVRQNWLGFSRSGNSGSGLGAKFARELHHNLHRVFKNFGAESITKSSHLEKVCLFSDGVGRDHLSDFTTNLIKFYLLEYTQEFALTYLRAEQTRKVAVQKVRFDYERKRWMPASYVLPFIRGDYVILTPKDMLTRDAAWINRQDLLSGVEDIYEAVPDEHLRSQINAYFASQLSEDPSEKEIKEAAASTVNKFPVLIDYYIKHKEENAAEAHRQSDRKVAETQKLFIDQVRRLVDEHLAGTSFYKPANSFDESLARVHFLKHVIEANDGWRFFYVDNTPVKQEVHLQLLFRLTWHGTHLDVNREPNNGRGPVDYAISYGGSDKTLIEFKLAKNSKLESNLRHQVKTYEEANRTPNSITVIMYFTDEEHARVLRILKKLDLASRKNVVLIDATPKRSASLL
ncbi:MAG TPA: hypothetical protein VEY50_03870 [Lysobacter sp.]|nr:hypothetical protein [Lysobacter sp.]